MSCQKKIDLLNKYLLHQEGGKKACLKGAELYGTNLAGVNLAVADLQEVSLKRSLLWDANLEGAYF